MKKDIHPKYEKTIIKCACGNVIETRSTAGGELHVELCSACHPFFTGKQKFIDTAGRVDKFRARVEASESKKQSKSKKSEAKSGKKTNQEKLAELKKELAPVEVTQESSSGEELAAADEIKDKFAEHKKDNQ